MRLMCGYYQGLVWFELRVDWRRGIEGEKGEVGDLAAELGCGQIKKDPIL